ncbi:hypothetical protein ACFVS2_22230 [Brevibacillus sp. NPDC058079]|uniref:hypothetical protein n=1 Tax=Brevibacillus sp. NPDC058079 TaxID=3346330 RepID=UPI0036EA248D
MNKEFEISYYQESSNTCGYHSLDEIKKVLRIDEIPNDRVILLVDECVYINQFGSTEDEVVYEITYYDLTSQAAGFTSLEEIKEILELDEIPDSSVIHMGNGELVLISEVNSDGE